MTDLIDTYQRMINAARLELEGAGNPGYAVLSAQGGEFELGPMIYASLRPALAHADRTVALAEPGEKVCIVSRATEGQRIVFTVMDSRSRKLHQQFEVIEKSISEEDTVI